MTQAELNRAVATVTGETVKTISELGFSVADPSRVRHDPEPYGFDAHVVDWDELEGWLRPLVYENTVTPHTVAHAIARTNHRPLPRRPRRS